MSLWKRDLRCGPYWEPGLIRYSDLTKCATGMGWSVLPLCNSTAFRIALLKSASLDLLVQINLQSAHLSHFFLFYLYLYIYPPDFQESDGGAIHRVSNYPDLFLEMLSASNLVEILL